MLKRILLARHWFKWGLCESGLHLKGGGIHEAVDVDVAVNIEGCVVRKAVGNWWHAVVGKR